MWQGHPPLLDDLLVHGGALGQRRPAILEAGRTYTYETINEGVNATVRTFAAGGYRPGHRVAFRLPTSATLLMTVIGALKTGLTITLLSQTLGNAALALRLNDFDPDCVIDNPDAPFPIAPPLRPPRSHAGMVVLWTSGSSGIPRGLVFHVNALLWNAANNATVLGLRSDDRALVQLDSAYCYALVHQIFSHLLIGASIALPSQPPWLAGLATEIERSNATTLAIVPSMLGAILRVPALRKGLGALRLVTVGGGAAGEELLHEAASLVGGNLYVTYGLTEAGPRVCTRRVASNEPRSPGLVGRPLPGVEVSVDGSGHREGELCVRTPSARIGCLHAGAFVPSDPLVRTGDLATIETDGAVRILGRCKRMIDRGGLKIAPGEIESVLRQYPHVIDARVVGLRHERLGEVPKAYVLAASPAPLVAELARHCLEQLGREWVPAAIEFVSELPPEARLWKDGPT
jgi:acyl-coenzyme A synthetase/AMP-(fatty) acid ligase